MFKYLLKMEIDFKNPSEAFKYSEDDLKNILANYNRTLTNVDKDIDIIRKWLKSQKHILIETSDREILYFLTTCKFSFEKTKDKLNMYYCIRSMLPEFYQNSKPSSKDFQDILSIVNLIPLPQLTPDLNRVVVYNVVIKNSPKFKSDVINSFMALMLDTQPILDACLSNEYILDFTNVPLEYVLKYSIMDLKKMLTVIEKVYSSRIARIHIINAPGYCDALIAVIKAFLKEKIRSRLLMHKGYEPLYEYFPKAMLPSDFGGEEKSIAEIKAMLLKSLLSYEDHFVKLNGLNVVNESLKPADLKNDEVLGFHGSFRKLEVD